MWLVHEGDIHCILKKLYCIILQCCPQKFEPDNYPLQMMVHIYPGTVFLVGIQAAW